MSIKIRKAQEYYIVIIGAGANGSNFFRSLCQDIATYNKSSARKFLTTVYLVDADIVEEKNLDNQLFDEEDIGEFKVNSLIERYGVHYNLVENLRGVTEYVTSVEQVQVLFNEYFTHSRQRNCIPVIVSLVDNNATRQVLNEFFYSNYLNELIYIDTAVEGIHVIPDKRPFQYTEDEEQTIEQSGFSGQMVIGYKYANQVLLEPVGKLYPDILQDMQTRFPGQSCGAVIINNPQRSATNRFAANITNNAINNLFHLDEIVAHEIVFNARMNGSVPRYIPKNIVNEYKNLNKRREF